MGREVADRHRRASACLELAAAGKSQVEIAEIVGCHQSTVSRTLADWSDTRGLARRYAEAKSLEMMKRFVADASPAEILKMQAKLDVVREDRVIGGDNNPVVIFNPQPPPMIDVISGATPPIDYWRRMKAQRDPLLPSRM